MEQILPDNPPEHGLVAQLKHAALETFHATVADSRDRRVTRLENKATKLERYRAVGSELLAFTGIIQPEAVIESPDSFKPGFIQRRRENRWANHAEKRKDNSYDRSNHSAYGGTWQGSLMKLSSGFSRIKADLGVSRSYKQGDISVLEKRAATRKNSTTRNDILIPEGAHQRIERASSLFSGETLLRARTHGLARESRIKRAEEKSTKALNNSATSKRKSEYHRQRKSEILSERKAWIERKQQGLV